MSRHWAATRQETLEQGQDLTKALDEIKKKNPALAKRLAAIDWSDIRAHVAKQALEDTAAHFGMKLQTRLATETDYYGKTAEKPAGTIVGILATDSEFLGVAIDGGKPSLFWNRLDHSPNGKTEQQRRWQKYFEERRQIRALEAMAKIVGKNVQSNTDATGTTTINFAIEEVLQ